MAEIPGYRIIEKLCEDPRRIIYRGVSEQGVSKTLPVIIKTLKVENPDTKDLARLRHEYEITKTLVIEDIVKPYELVKYNNNLALIMEEFGAGPLKSLIVSGQIELAQFLRMAIRISEILGEIHGKSIIHKNIKPQSIFINSTTEQIKLTDFGISSFFRSEGPGDSGIDMVEGSLAYSSPEQTGRMNRAIDYRSDLYSLGIVFYEMLTGRLPFQAEDPLELVHSHIAKKPDPPQRVDVEIPQAVSKIILKLLSKAPEDRYQSTYGLKTDLELCQSELKSMNKIGDFEPGKDDRSPMFKVSHRIYGRDTEISALNESLNLADRGESVLALIAGNSGVGKTSLVREVHKSSVHRKGFYISGKFERLQQDIPYSGFIQAFQEIIDQILMESKDRVAIWKEKILNRIGPNGKIIVDVIPQMEHMIGQQKPAPRLPPSESANRFNTVFQNFVGVFCQKERPLIIFLDDLHWADSASLQLLRILVTSPDIRYLLILGAYRENEVDAFHPLQRLIDELEESNIKARIIYLKPLNKKHVGYMVSDTLNSERKETQSLAHLVYEKTNGNPFFVNEFLKTLYQKNHTYFDFQFGRWIWDLDEIMKAGIADNLVKLMTDKIQRLSKTGQKVLKLAACIGNHFSLGSLAEVNEHSPFETLGELRESISEGLVLALSEEFRYTLFNEENRSGVSNLSFKFLHDRVQQAAYSLLSSRQKQRLHLKIGRLLLKKSIKEQMDERICEITDHLNRGRALLNDQKEIYELAGLNLEAGKKAKTSIAYESALRYITAGMEMLSGNCWQDQYELTLSLHLEGAEAAYLSSDFSRARDLNRYALMKARTVLDRVKVYEIIIQSFIVQNQYQEAIDTASKILNQLGVFLPRNPGRLRILLGLIKTKMVLHGINIDDLYKLPQMTDPYKLAAMRILMGVFNPFYKSIREMFPSIAFRMVILSVKYGNSDISPFAYALYGLLLGLIGEIVPGYRFGSFALDLFEKYYTRELTAKMYNVFFVLIKKWKAHLREALDPLLEAYQKGLETGDLEWAALAVRGYCLQLFFTGRNLETVSREIAKYCETLQKIKQYNTLHNLMLIRQSTLNLMGRDEDKTCLKGESFNEEEMLPVLIDANDTDTIAGIRFHKAMLCYLFEDYSAAIENFKEIEKHRETRGQFGFVLEARFYYSLILLAVYPEMKGAEQKRTMKNVVSYQKMMRRGAEHAPMNYLHKWYLIEAERDRVLGKDMEAMEYYEQAIKGAQKYEYIQEEALSNELAARFYLIRKKKKIAAAYMKEAYSCYRRWGAYAKAKDLENNYGYLLTPDHETVTKVKGSFTAAYDQAGIKLEELDLTTVLKASQVISGEILLGALLEKMMKIVIEVSGAERGLLILEKEGRYFIEAEGDAGKINLLQNMEATGSGKLSHAVINYVISTKESVILNDAAEEELFQKDQYITQIRPRSLLCAPIIHQVKLKGAIYLENNLSGGVFTEERVEIVKLIASQTAISLENAVLFRSLLEDIEKRKKIEHELRRAEEMARSLLDAMRDSLTLIDPGGVILSLNKTAAQRLGRPPKNIIGRCLWDLLPEVIAERRKGFVERAVRSRKAIRVKDEQRGVLEDNVICPVFGLQGKVAKIAILARDITEQRKVAEQVKKQEKQLIRSDKLVFMGELAAGIAHEINTPNYSIMLSTAYLSKAYPDILSIFEDYCEEKEDLRVGGLEYEEFSKTLPESVNRIRDCAQKISLLVKELKSFARDEPEDFMGTVDINVTVQSAVVLATPIIKKLTDNFTVQLEENIPKIRGNAQKIEQVLLNLLQNACQSLPDRRKSVSIQTSHDKEKGSIVIDLRDEGAGMTEEVLGKICEPFFTTKREKGGTGLGISISKGIVEEHGGALAFESKPGKGTVATVKFPVKEDG